MPEIRVLDKLTIDQIAAGEVVERPSSVVKELVENAIDAGATAVTVEVRNGGIDLIRVTDNGCGIERSQIPTAFLRHATSKIRSAEDLERIMSLGFRGEALSSIAAVSELELITKRREDLSGTSYEISGGEEKSISEIGAPDGTTFLVKNIFYNTPARRKFLKTAVTETSYIADLMERIAMSHPEVSLRFIANGSTKLVTSGNGKVRDLIYTIYGRETANELTPLDFDNGTMKITGFLGKPVLAKGNRGFENYFINGRYIKSSLIAKAIEAAYAPFMMQHRYPFAVLYFTLPAEEFDVNVHPNKMELRFRSEAALYDTVLKAVRAGLERKEFIPSVRLSEDGERKEKEKDREKLYRAPEPFETARLRENAVAAARNPGRTGNAAGGQENRGSEPVPGNKPVLRPLRSSGSAPVETGAPETKRPVTETGIPVTDTPKPRVPSSEIPEARVPVDMPVFPEEDIPVSESVREITQYQMKQKMWTSEALKPKDGERLPFDDVIPEKDGSGENDLIPLGETPAAEEMNASVTLPKKEVTVASVDDVPETLFGTKFISEEGMKKHRLIGQVFQTYWLVQMEDKLFILDQHAAHEKVLYERKVRELKEKKHSSQMISPPVMISLTAKEELLLNRYMNAFTELGYEISSFGGKEYAISAVPDDLFGLDLRSLFTEILSEMEEEITEKDPEMILQKLASMSCKAAVKGHDLLSFEEADGLIRELLTLDNPYACPHGRPTLISISRRELEKKFKRIV